MDRRKFVKRFSALPLMAGVVPIVAQAVKAERAVSLERLIPDAAVVNPEFDDFAARLQPLDGMKVCCEIVVDLVSNVGDPLPEIGAPLVVKCRDIRAIGRVVDVQWNMKGGERMIHRVEAVAQEIEQLPLVIEAREPRLFHDAEIWIDGVEARMTNCEIRSYVEHEYFVTSEDLGPRDLDRHFVRGAPGRLALL